MRLLVSVANAEEAATALAGGTDIIDAKDPLTGALGAVSLATLRSIVAAVGGARPVTAALGDASDPVELERDARLFASTGIQFIKIGFAGLDSPDRISGLVAAAVRGAGDVGMVAAFYADAAAEFPFIDLVTSAALGGAAGVLIDTADKHGPGLRQLVTAATLRGYATAARDAGLFIAMAGKLIAEDLSFVLESGADIAGVRGAACDDGRTGRVAADRVRMLRAAAA